MVTENADILNTLKSQNNSQLDIDKLNTLIDQYPYFQALWALKTKWLKEKRTYTGTILQQTAARTIDRKVLYKFIEITNTKPQASTTKKKNLSPVDKNSVKLSVKKNTLTKLKKQEDFETSHTKKDIKRNYIEWLKAFQEKNKTEKTKKVHQIDLVEKFLKERPKIVPKKNIIVKPPDIIEKSISEKQMLMTETLANLYVKQKKYDKAIQAFRILSLKYPKKSSYFANQIKEIKQNLK